MPSVGRVNLSARSGVGRRTVVCRLLPREGGFFARWVGRSWGLGEAQMDGRPGFIGGAVVSVGDLDVLGGRRHGLSTRAARGVLCDPPGRWLFCEVRGGGRKV